MKDEWKPVGISTVGQKKSLKCELCKKKVDALNYTEKGKICNNCYDKERGKI